MAFTVTKHPINPLLRVIIPLLRYPSWVAALFALSGVRYALYIPPLQKLFYRPVFLAMWGILALLPFILIRNRRAYLIYCSAFVIVGGWILFDTFTPFRYVAPNYHETVNEGASYLTSYSDDHCSYYITRFNPSFIENWLLPVITIWPLLLGTLYHYAYARKIGSAEALNLAG